MAADPLFRDLRRTLGATAGCTDAQVRSITGRRTHRVAAVDVRPGRTFAEGEMKPLERAMRRTKVDRNLNAV